MKETKEKRLEWFPFYHADWFLATLHWTPQMKGWYITLLCWSALEGKPEPGYLPNNPDFLKKIAGFYLTQTKQNELEQHSNNTRNDALELEEDWEQVLSKWVPEGDFLYNSRLREIVRKAYRTVENRRRAGILSGRRRNQSKVIEKKKVRTTPETTLSNVSSVVGPLPETTNLSLRSLLEEIFNYWKEVFDKASNTKLSPKRERKIKARLKDGYTLEQMKHAIDGCKFSREQRPELVAYDDLELIFRDVEKIDMYLSHYEQSLKGNNNGRQQSTTTRGEQRLLEIRERLKQRDEDSDEEVLSNSGDESTHPTSSGRQLTLDELH